LYAYFDFDNVQTTLLKSAQETGDSLPQLGHLGRVVGIHSKCGAAQLATTRSGRKKVGHDASALGFDDRGGPLRCRIALDQGRPRFGLCERLG
jgi:hypothetical protein